MAFTATTDARYVEGPCLCYGPTAANLHGPDEWVDLESLEQTATVAAPRRRVDVMSRRLDGGPARRGFDRAGMSGGAGFAGAGADGERRCRLRRRRKRM